MKKADKKVVIFLVIWTFTVIFTTVFVYWWLNNAPWYCFESTCCTYPMWICWLGETTCLILTIACILIPVLFTTFYKEEEVTD